MMEPPPTRTGSTPHPLTPMSLKALYGPVPLSAPLSDTPATFVTAEGSSLPRLRDLGQALHDRYGWDLRTIPGGHDLPEEQPEALAALLLDIAAATP